MGDLPTGIVTFLFTDLEGSTRLWQEHPEAMKAALARHDDILRQAVDANGGHVVKSTGDGLHAVFAFAAEAVNAAAVAQQGLEAERWSTTGPLRVRMGIYTGEAESRAGDYYGNAVNVAARLMAAAHGGQAVASQTTADLVDGTVDDIELLDLGTHRLRGLAQPERVFQLVVPGCPVAFPAIRSLDSVLQRESLDVTLPDRVTDQPALTFVGRHAELDRLQHELKDAAATSRRHVAFVSGEAGIGKTSVVFEMAQRAHADGAVVLYGRCEEFGSPYGPWVEALSHLVSEAPEELFGLARRQPWRRAGASRSRPARPDQWRAEPGLDRPRSRALPPLRGGRLVAAVDVHLRSIGARHRRPSLDRRPVARSPASCHQRGRTVALADHRHLPVD
ncbi:MAG: adenylate/guanylate cyclase domain-containing protein [Actinomycetota bacterium]|nr:adenylate/guanylate cyclase domain-containing protein [Actinomycetota bacterium]